jgi:hypothetical protein
MSGFALTAQVDPLNFAVVRLKSFFGDTLLGHATGFFYYGVLDNKPNHWLVTNWHVLAGRNADDPSQILHPKAALPNRVSLTLTIKGDQPEYGSVTDGRLLQQELFFELYDQQGLASWTQHAEKNEIDVAIINTSGFLASRYHFTGINELPMQHDMLIEVGNEVFILGYPLGFTHFMNTPIWKRGSIASEPNLETPDARKRVVIDATTRQGMSGAPVVMRAKTHYIAESGEIKTQINATRWLGIYASRPALPPAVTLIDEDRRAEVGFFYKMGCVHDAIAKGVRGPPYDELP